MAAKVRGTAAAARPGMGEESQTHLRDYGEGGSGGRVRKPEREDKVRLKGSR